MPNASDVLTLPEVLKMHLGSLILEENSEKLLPVLSAGEVATGLLQFAEVVDLRAGDQLYQVGDEADAMYIILSGEVVCDWDLESFSRCGLRSADHFCSGMPIILLRRHACGRCLCAGGLGCWSQPGAAPQQRRAMQRGRTEGQGIGERLAGCGTPQGV